MFSRKNGIAILTGVICFACIAIVTTALIVANLNSANYRASKDKVNVIESSAYTKVYTLSEVRNMAMRAYANHYVEYSEEFVDFNGFERLILDEMLEVVPEEQLAKFTVFLYDGGITVEYKR